MKYPIAPPTIIPIEKVKLLKKIKIKMTATTAAIMIKYGLFMILYLFGVKIIYFAINPKLNY